MGIEVLCLTDSGNSSLISEKQFRWILDSYSDFKLRDSLTLAHGNMSQSVSHLLAYWTYILDTSACLPAWVHACMPERPSPMQLACLSYTEWITSANILCTAAAAHAFELMQQILCVREMRAKSALSSLSS
jgi:hypothetical protein